MVSVVDLVQRRDVLRPGEPEHERADAVLGRERHGVVLRAREVQRRVRHLHGPRQDRVLGDLEQLAVPLEALAVVAAPHAADHAQRLFDLGVRAIGIDAHRRHLLERRAPAGAEVEAPTGEHVEHRRALGNPDRVVVVERHAHDAVPDADARRLRCDPGEEDLGRAHVRVPLEAVVLDGPDAVEPISSAKTACSTQSRMTRRSFAAVASAIWASKIIENSTPLPSLLLAAPGLRPGSWPEAILVGLQRGSPMGFGKLNLTGGDDRRARLRRDLDTASSTSTVRIGANARSSVVVFDRLAQRSSGVGESSPATRPRSAETLSSRRSTHRSVHPRLSRNSSGGGLARPRPITCASHPSRPVDVRRAT